MTENLGLSPKKAFEILYKAFEGEIDPQIPLRIKASPIEHRVPRFYVIDPNDFHAKIGQLASSINSASELDDAKNLLPLVKKHLELETSEALREQSNLRAARSTGCLPSTDLICVKYQGINGKHTDFWWSPEHDYKIGIAIRSMAKVLRKTRAKDSSAKSQSLEQRKHGFMGKLYTLVEREDSSLPFDRTKLNGKLVSDLAVKAVPSLVDFYRDPGVAKRKLASLENINDNVSSKLIRLSPSSSSDSVPNALSLPGLNLNYAAAALLSNQNQIGNLNLGTLGNLNLDALSLLQLNAAAGLQLNNLNSLGLMNINNLNVNPLGGLSNLIQLQQLQLLMSQLEKLQN